MTIAVDFDGTIVTHKYPEIGEERPFAIETLKMLQKEKQETVKKALEGQMYVPFKFENEGTKIIYYGPEEYTK